MELDLKQKRQWNICTRNDKSIRPLRRTRWQWKREYVNLKHGVDHEDGEDKGEEEKGNGKRRRVFLLCWTLIQQTLVTRSPFWWARVSYFFRQNNILNSFFCDIGLLWDFCDILRIRYRLPKFMIRECKANSLILPPLHSQTEMRFHHDPQSCGRFFLDPSSKAPPRLSSWILCPPHLMVAPRPRLFHSV